jgi:hypothetical protein
MGSVDLPQLEVVGRLKRVSLMDQERDAVWAAGAVAVMCEQVRRLVAAEYLRRSNELAQALKPTDRAGVQPRKGAEL